MKAIICQYHPAVPARWRCSECQTNLCAHCAPKTDVRMSAPPCPSCKRLLGSLGIGNTIKPFWERIPRFFLYPMNTTALLVAVGLALLSALSIIPIIGLKIALISSAMSIRYCYGVLYNTALGNLEPQELGAQSEFRGALLKQIGLFVILFSFVVAVILMTHSMFLSVIAGLLTLLVVPAAIMTLAIDEELGKAVNPLHLMGVISRIGKSYFLLWLMLVLLLGGPGWFLSVISAHMPPVAGVLLSQFVSTYFSIAMFHMMGYVVYQYHEELGFNVAHEYEEPAAPGRIAAGGGAAAGQAALAAPVAPDRAQMLITEGKFAEAAQELEAQINESPDDLRRHDRFFRLMLTLPEKKEFGARHADAYIGKLIAQNKMDKALDVLREAAARWGNIEIRDAADTVTMARLAHQRNQSKLALPLLSRFPQRFPKNERIPEALLLAAEILSHGLGKDDMALQVLDQLRRGYPEHPLKPKIENLQAALMRIKQRQAGAAPAAAP